MSYPLYCVELLCDVIFPHHGNSLEIGHGFEHAVSYKSEGKNAEWPLDQ